MEDTDSEKSIMDDIVHSMAQLDVTANAQTPSTHRTGQKKLTKVKSSVKDNTVSSDKDLKYSVDGLERHQGISLPSITMGNVRSLDKNMDHLVELLRNQQMLQESSVLCFTETWLHKDIPDSKVTVDGFKTVRADSSPNKTGKIRGRGLAILINNKWCDPGRVTVEKHVCRLDIDLLAVSLQPYNLPREFSHVIILAVYIITKAQKKTVRDVIHEVVAELQTAHPGAFIAISGDFNHVTLDDTLPTFTQFVKCTTRIDGTLDLLYANVKEAYRCIKLPPLGTADHNLIHLQPL